MRSLIDRLVDSGLRRDEQIVASAVGALIGILISLGILLAWPQLVDYLFG